jgi:orotate phosphoribosyltransferase
VDHSELAEAIVRAAWLGGDFTLRSGAKSGEYFDKYRFEADPVLLRAILGELAGLVPDGAEVLAGLELGGVPLATGLSQLLGIPVAFVRKKPKEYGTCRLAEGAQVSGRRVVVVEDVVTSGGQVVDSCARLRELGATVRDVVCVIDREAGGGDTLGRNGLALAAAFTMSELRRAGASQQAHAADGRRDHGE